MDPQTRAVVEELAREMASQRRDITALKRGQRTPQLAHSSLEEGQALEVRDDTGQVRGRIGWIGGAVGTTTEGGNPVSAPAAPAVVPSLGGLRVTWNGTLSDPDAAIPVDFDHMAVHVSTTTGFSPSAATYVGTIRRAGDGGMLPVVPLPYVPHYVVLVPVTTSGVQGTPSVEVVATPLQTSGIDLQANSVEAVHIKAGAVEADKLEAILVLATTIIAGIPGDARVELDQDGLRGYNELNEVVFAIDSSGNAAFTGNITGSEISGSRISMGTAPGPTGAIEETTNGVQNRVQSGAMKAQLSAQSGQANFLAVSDTGNPSTPMAGFAAFPDKVVFVLDSSGQSSDGLPSITGVASPTSADLVTWAKRNSLTDPWQSTYAATGEAGSRWVSGDGSEVRVRARNQDASILLTAPEATDTGDAQGSGYLFTMRHDNDIASVSLQGPEWSAGTGPERGLRSTLHLEGARPDRAYTRAAHSAQRHIFYNQHRWGGGIDDSDGVVEVTETHSIYAPRHAPVRGELLGPLTSYSTGNSFYDFPPATFAPFNFKTSWSGRVKVEIMMCGLNNNSDASSIALGFRLSGGSTVPASLKRAVYVRSAGAGFGSSQSAYFSDFLDLVANSTYTLTPMYRITSGSVAYYDTALANHILITPSM